MPLAPTAKPPGRPILPAEPSTSFEVRFGAILDDLQLETQLSTPANDDGKAIAIVCHPHPLYGGSMTNKVVTTIAKALLSLNMPVIRFNFRGVGDSPGEYDHGIGETDDLATMVDWARKQYPKCKLWLAGFSFGSFVSAHYAHQHPVDQLISIAPPVNHFDFSPFADIHCPWLIVQGDRDEVVPLKAVLAWTKGLPPSAQLCRLPEATHFFHGQLIALKDLLIHSLQ